MPRERIPQSRLTGRRSSSEAAVPEPDAQQTLWSLRRPGGAPITAVLLSYDHGIELHLYRGADLRRQLRFLRDLRPVKYAERLRGKLEARGYRDGRRDRRVEGWPAGRSRE